MRLSTYAHLIAEYEDAERIDAEAEIRKARGHVGSDLVRTTVAEALSTLLPRAGFRHKKPHESGDLLSEYRYRDSNPGFRRERAAS